MRTSGALHKKESMDFSYKVFNNSDFCAKFELIDKSEYNTTEHTEVQLFIA